MHKILANDEAELVSQVKVALRIKEAEDALREERNSLERVVEKRTAALHRMNRLLDSIVENIPNMIFLKDARELRFVRFNRAGEDLLGYFRDDLLGKDDYDFFPKEQADFFTERDRKVLHGKEVVDIPEEPIQTRNKGERILHTKKVPILDASGEPEYLLGISEDITERKQAEEKIKASLLEKETMLKEIHHRVKNNLQVISSLLELQSSYVQDEKSREIFQESQDRVSTMAKIHTMLCQSEDMSGVDFGGFIGDLAGRLQQSYGIAGSRVGIHVNVDVSLTIETSIPCGLILNELVSNALKHAFPEGRGGEVNISMIKAGDRFVLTVQDNGIGFPEAVDFQNAKSLGLELVNLLVGQMNGAITLRVEGGTTFIITFPAVSKGG